MTKYVMIIVWLVVSVMIVQATSNFVVYTRQSVNIALGVK